MLTVGIGCFSADPYIYMLIGGVLELPTYLLLVLSMMYLGRRNILIALYLLPGLCIAINAILIIQFPDGELFVYISNIRY